MKTFREALQLVGRENYLRLAVLIPLGLAVSATEVIGASMVYSLIGVATGTEASLDLPLVGDIRDLFDVDTDTLLLWSAVAMGVFFLIKSAVKMFSEYATNRIVDLMAARLSARMMRGYLTMPYPFHLHRNSSELLRNVNGAVRSVFSEALTPMIKLVSQVLIAGGLLGLLMSVSPIATGVALVVLGGSAMLVARIVQPRLARLGAKLHRYRKTSIQLLQQSFHGVRDIKMLGAEAGYGRNFLRLRREMARVHYRTAVVKAFAGEVIQLALLGFILLFFIFTLLSGQDTSEMLAVLGLFAYAGQRLETSVKAIVSAFNSFRHGEAPIADLAHDLELIRHHELPATEPDPLPFARDIRIADVVFRYEAAHDDALRGIDLTIPRGEVLGICGPTGGGKSTLVDVICGLLEPTSGRVTVDGQDLTEHARAWQRDLGVVPQMVFLTDGTLRENIALAEPTSRIDDAALQEAVDLAQLREFVDGLPAGLDTVVGERGVRVSGGQRQRIAIARALYRRPEVLIFDEGTSALDNATEREVISAIERLRGQHTIIMVAHRLSTVERADRILMLDQGKIAALGPYDELLTSSPAFAALAGANG